MSLIAFAHSRHQRRSSRRATTALIVVAAFAATAAALAVADRVVPTSAVAPMVDFVSIRSGAVGGALAVRVDQAPTTSPPATSPPGSSSFPSGSTTGVPAGLALQKSGSITVNTAGAILEALDISGTVTINASNVVLRNSRVTGSDFAIVRVRSDVTSVRIENTEINGRGLNGTANSMGVYGPAAVLRSNIYGVENGVAPFSGSTVQDNYIHGLGAPGSPHYDGIQIDGGVSNVVVSHNTVDVSDHDQTSAVMIDNYFGPISNIAVTSNRLLGGGYTVYSDGQFSGGSISGVSFVGNRLGKGYWGYASIVGNTPVWSGNVDDSTGANVSAL